MDSNYSVLPRNSFIELQLHDDLSPDRHVASTNPKSVQNHHTKLDPFGEDRYFESRDIDDLDDEFDDFPLIAEGKETKSGVYGAVFNLTTSIIGAGIMALPATMKVLGLVLGFVLIILMGILTEKIDSLSLTSAASVALAVVFVLVACVIAFIKLMEGQVPTPRVAPDFGSEKAILDLLVVIPIMMNAYVCHFNVQPIYNELEGRSPQKMNRVGRITTLLCIVVYASTAISGYLLFGKDTESDVLTNFDKDLGIRFSSALNYIVRVGYVLHLALVFPVVHFSLRQTVDALVFKGSSPPLDSRNRSLVLTVVLLGIIYFGSTMIPNIWTAFKFTGATTAVSLGFIFPPLIALKLGHQGEGLSFREKILSWVMLILAILVGIVGVIGNIYSIKSKSE